MKAVILLSLGLLSFSLFPAFGQSGDDVLAVLDTPSGELVIEFFRDDAPGHVDNFLSLVSDGHYENTRFHRIIDGFMIQGGDPNSRHVNQTNSWGTGDAGYTIEAEFNGIKHARGIVSMARSAHPDSASSQFFIMHRDSNFLDGQYTVFGRIVTDESFATLDRLASVETDPNDRPISLDEVVITSAKIVDRDGYPGLLEPGEPERFVTTIEGEDGSDSAEYSHDGLGISFLAPTGWLIQEPPKTHSSVPDLVVVGPPGDGGNPAISLFVIPADQLSLDQYMEEIDRTLQPSIDSGQLEIISDQRTEIN